MSNKKDLFAELTVGVEALENADLNVEDAYITQKQAGPNLPRPLAEQLGIERDSEDRLIFVVDPAEGEKINRNDMEPDEENMTKIEFEDGKPVENAPSANQ